MKCKTIIKNNHLSDSEIKGLNVNLQGPIIGKVIAVESFGMEDLRTIIIELIKPIDLNAIICEGISYVGTSHIFIRFKLTGLVSEVPNPEDDML